MKLQFALVEGALARCRAAGADVRVSFYDGTFDRQKNYAATNSNTDRVDKTVLNRAANPSRSVFP